MSQNKENHDKESEKMTDDKEERRRTPSRKALNAVVQELNCAINSCENASLQRDFQAVHDWLLNPLAPKHTDDEYDYNDRILNTMINERDHWVSELDKEVAVLKVRIKELELFKPLCFQEERCYDCQELLNPCAWLEKAKVSFMKGREKVVRK